MEVDGLLTGAGSCHVPFHLLGNCCWLPHCWSHPLSEKSALLLVLEMPMIHDWLPLGGDLGPNISEATPGLHPVCLTDGPFLPTWFGMGWSESWCTANLASTPDKHRCCQYIVCQCFLQKYHYFIALYGSWPSNGCWERDVGLHLSLGMW